MKKAFKWLDANNVSYDFHDYKKHGADENILQSAFEAKGWDNVINRRGTTWRKLPDEVKNTMDASQALAIALDNPSIIKRPMIVKDSEFLLGFDENIYETFLK